PVGRARHLREVACWDENARRQRLRRHVPVEGVVTQAEVECRSAQGPLVLCEYASGCRVLQEFKRRRPDRDRSGDSIPKCIGYGVVDLVGVRITARTPKVVPLIREAGLEVMCARYIRRAEATVVFGEIPPGISRASH